MIVAVIVLAWLLINTLATLIIICIDGGTPSSRASDWIGIGISCVLSPIVMMFIVQPVYTWIDKLIRKRRKK
jgi:hypothetical protein